MFSGARPQRRSPERCAGTHRYADGVECWQDPQQANPNHGVINAMDPGNPGGVHIQRGSTENCGGYEGSEARVNAAVAAAINGEPEERERLRGCA